MYVAHFVWNCTEMHANNLQSALVHLMAWCRQVTSHYVKQCWPSSMSHYRVTRPQWVNLGRLVIAGDLLTLTTPKESMLGPVGKDFHCARPGLCWRDAHTPKLLTHYGLMTYISFTFIDLVQCWFTRANELTHWGWVKYICVSTTCQHCFRWWLAACLAPSHHLFQCCHVVN